MSDFSLHSLILILPELFLALAGLALLVLGVVRAEKGCCAICWAVAGCFVLAALFLLGIEWDYALAFNGMFIMDQFAGVLKIMVLMGLLIAAALSAHFLRQEQMAGFEFPILLLFAGLGMLIMISANDFLTAYMGMELQALSLYVLAAIRRDNVRAAEAGVKYFLLGALSSGFLLFGISLVYGYTGSINFTVIADVLAQPDIALTGVVVGMVFIIVGVAFKLSAVPFHMWTPDVYEGSATAVTALFAIVPKIAAMALLMRILFGPFGSMLDQWQDIIWILSVGSMIIGGYAALVQTNIKRLMAYSSISHMGYAMIGIAVGTQQGAAATILYLMIYMVMVSGVFGIILMMRRNGRAVQELSDMAGLSRHSPLLAYIMAILMFSMGAIPPMAGFFSKMFVFQAAVAQEMYVLALIGVLTSVIAAFYYLRIIKVVFFDDPADPFDQEKSFARRIVVLLSLAFVLAFIFVPNILLDISNGAAAALF